MGDNKPTSDSRTPREIHNDELAEQNRRMMYHILKPKGFVDEDDAARDPRTMADAVDIVDVSCDESGALKEV